MRVARNSELISGAARLQVTTGLQHGFLVSVLFHELCTYIHNKTMKAATDNTNSLELHDVRLGHVSRQAKTEYQ